MKKIMPLLMVLILLLTGCAPNTSEEPPAEMTVPSIPDVNSDASSASSPENESMIPQNGSVSITGEYLNLSSINFLDSLNRMEISLLYTGGWSLQEPEMHRIESGNMIGELMVTEGTSIYSVFKASASSAEAIDLLCTESSYSVGEGGLKGYLQLPDVDIPAPDPAAPVIIFYAECFEDGSGFPFPCFYSAEAEKSFAEKSILTFSDGSTCCVQPIPFSFDYDSCGMLLQNTEIMDRLRSGDYVYCTVQFDLANVQAKWYSYVEQIGDEVIGTLFYAQVVEWAKEIDAKQ